MMKKHIITAMFALTLLVTGGAVAQASTSFNTDPQDRATIRVMNITDHPNSTTDWSTSVSATPGDVIAVAIYYHNTGAETAANTMVRLYGGSQLPASSSHSISGSVSSSNSNTASGSAQVNIAGAHAMRYISGSVRWQPNQSTAVQTLPHGQDGSEIFNGGLNIGSIAPGWGSQGSVVLHFQIDGQASSTVACNDGIDNDGDGDIDMNDEGCGSSTDTDEYNSSNNNGSSPDVTTNAATNLDIDEATLKGSYDANGASTTTWFEYARSSSDVSDGDGTVVGSTNQGTGSGTMSYRLSGLRDNTTYYYRAVARNSYGTDRGSIRSFTTDAEDNNSNNNDGSVTALTSLSSAVTQTSAVINGVVENSTGEDADGWFEYGRTTSLGSRTSSRSLGSSSSRAMSETISGLAPNTIYYFRAVAEADNGDISRGDTLMLKTAASPVVVTPTPTVITVPTSVTSNSRFVFLKIENRFENVQVGDTVDYTVTYRNISSRTLNKVVIEVAFPKEIAYARAAEGEYDSDRKVLVINLGTLAPGDAGTIAVDGKVLSAARSKDALITNAVMKYTNPVTTVQEEAIAYVVNKVSRENNNGLGAASIFGDGSFLPTTLLGWLVLILAIFGVVVLGRNLYNKNQAAKAPVAHH